MKTLKKDISCKPLWTSYMACFKSMSDYLELGYSAAWIFGASGHAFIMNIHPTLCPSGPTAFSQQPFNALAANLGFDLYGTSFHKSSEGFQQKLEETWINTKLAIDNDMPTYGWDLDLPEFYMIFGYDKENYLFKGFDSKTLKKKWDTLGTSNNGWICIYSANANDRIADVNKTLKDAFSFALKFAKKNKDWTYPEYCNGLKAYDCWMDSLQQSRFKPFGLAFNAQVWAECRNFAREFLKEAKGKLNTKVLDNLIEHYDVISWSLQKVVTLFPMGIERTDSESIETAIDSLFLAKEAEKAALAEMKLVMSQL